MVAKPQKAGATSKPPCTGCNRAYTKREKLLIQSLLLVTFIASLYSVCYTFKNYNRYELYPYFGFEEPIVYKLDKKTGKVTAINQLWEFDTERFQDKDSSAKHWAFPNRMKAQESDLLFRSDYH